MDLVVEYAENVLSGKTVANKYLKLAAKRFFKDFDKPWLRWDSAAAERVCSFCRDMCVVQDPISRLHRPFVLLPWQRFVFGNIYGWKIQGDDPLGRVPGSRRYRVVYLETGKGSGKSPMAGAAMLYALIGDGESQPEIYICAKTEEQALIPWRDVRDMIQANPSLAPNTENRDAAGICEIFGGAKEGRIICPATGGVIRTVAHHSDGAGISGPRPHMILVEEYHEHQTDTMREMLDDGKKGRLQPLTWIITNAGGQRLGPCWEEHTRATHILGGTQQGDDYFAAIYAIDAEDEEDGRFLTDRSCWPKANPSLGTVIREDYILGMIEKAKNSKAKLTHLKRFNFAIWPDAGGEWLKWEQWERVEVEHLPEDKLTESLLYIGFDLADKKDLTAMAFVWLHPSGLIYLRVRYFTPRDTLADRAKESNTYLEDWAAHGPHGRTTDDEQAFLEAVPGDILDYHRPARRLAEAHMKYGVHCVAYDRYHWGQFLLALDDERVEYFRVEPDPKAFFLTEKEWNPPGSMPGIAMADHPQGFLRSRAGQLEGLHMPTSIQRLEDRILAKDPQIAIEINPILSWNLTCAVVRSNESGATRFDKGTARKRYNNGKIDGLIATAMAVGAADQVWPEPSGLAAHWTKKAAKEWSSGTDN